MVVEHSATKLPPALHAYSPTFLEQYNSETLQDNFENLQPGAKLDSPRSKRKVTTARSVSGRMPASKRMSVRRRYTEGTKKIRKSSMLVTPPQLLPKLFGDRSLRASAGKDPGRPDAKESDDTSADSKVVEDEDASTPSRKPSGVIGKRLSLSKEATTTDESAEKPFHRLLNLFRLFFFGLLATMI